MEKWEYTGFEETSYNKAISRANELGEKGWELVTVNKNPQNVFVYMTFKRRKSNNK